MFAIGLNMQTKDFFRKNSQFPIKSISLLSKFIFMKPLIKLKALSEIILNHNPMERRNKISLILELFKP
jgi:hypothetical protein